MDQKSLIPEFTKINKRKVYNLDDYHWIYKNSKKAVINNQPIIDELAVDFSNFSGVGFQDVKSAFEVEFMYTETSINLILLYTNKDSNEVHYYLLNSGTETFNTLFN